MCELARCPRDYTDYAKQIQIIQGPIDKYNFSEHFAATNGKSIPRRGSRFKPVYHLPATRERVQQQFSPQPSDKQSPKSIKTGHAPEVMLKIDNVQPDDDGIYLISCFQDDAFLNPCDETGYFRIRVLESYKAPTNIDQLAHSLYQEMGRDVGQNVWFKWVQYTAMTVAKEDCFACAAARPSLNVVPAPYVKELDHTRMLKLFAQDTFTSNDDCVTSMRRCLSRIQKKSLLVGT